MSSARPETPPVPFAAIPFSRDPDFVSRGDILKQIEKRCSEPAGRVALVGLGGVGKSQVAIEFAHQLAARQPDVWVFWVHAGTQARVEQGFRMIADAAKLPGRNEPKADIPQLVYSWLSNERNGKWVLVLDSADDRDVFYHPVGDDKPERQPFASYLPQSQHGSMLITTRDRDLAFRLTGRHQNIIEVGPMAQADALTLLEKKLGSPSDIDVAVATDLVQALDLVPLAIGQAAAYIQARAPRSSPEKYLAEFREGEHKRSKLLEHDAGDLRRGGGASNAILTTLQISFDHIRAQRPSAADLLSLMSFFDPQGIPAWVLKPGTAKDAMGAKGPDINGGFEDDVAMLRNYCLIVAAEASDSFEMHSLVQLSTRRWLEVLGRQETFKQQFIERMAASFPAGFYQNYHQNLATCRSLFAHVQVALGYGTSLDTLAKGGSSWSLLARVQAAFGSRPPSRDAIEAWATLLHNGGSYARSQGRFELAQQMSGKAREVREKRLGNKNRATLSSMTLFAGVLLDRGQWEDAQKLFVQAMESYKAKLGADHPSTLTSMANLSTALVTQGLQEEAEKLEVQVMEARKKKLGADHLDTLKSMGNLASILGAQGRLEESEKLSEQVTEAFRTKLGADHPYTLIVTNNLAETYRRQGRWEEAKKLTVEVMEIRTKKLGADHPDTLMSISNLVAIRRNQGQLEKAEELIVKLIETRKTKLGADHPITLSSMGDLAAIYGEQGRWEETVKLLEQVIEAWKTKVGADHPDAEWLKAELVKARKCLDTDA